MLTIRLQRTGKKNQADFRIVLAEKEAPVNKKFVEVLGGYNPRKKAFRVKEDRMKYWISQNIEISPTVHNLLVTNKILDKPKVKAFNTPKKPISTSTESGAKTPATSAENETPKEETASVEKPEAAAVETPKSETPEIPQITA